MHVHVSNYALDGQKLYKKKKKGGIHTETWNRRRRGEEKEERKILAWHAAAREYNELARQTVET